MGCRRRRGLRRGDARLFRVWVATRAGRRLHSRAEEEFWQTVLAWLCANPMLPHAEVSPLVDYIDHRRAEAPGFSMKGRSVLAMLRGLREWHGQLAKEKAAAGRVFPASGFEPMDFDRSRRDVKGNHIVEIWHFRKILDARTLADEGRVMGHCVYSYARFIETRQCSIWTLTLRDNAGHWRDDGDLHHAQFTIDNSERAAYILPLRLLLTIRFFNSPGSSRTRPSYLASPERVPVCVRRSMAQSWTGRHDGGSLDNPKGGKAP